MVTFSHQDNGTAEAEWQRSGLAGIAELPLSAEELASTSFVVLAAHPDDETLGAGGFLSRLHAAGASIQVLLCTAGEASHPGSHTVTREELAAVRLEEFEGALSSLVPGIPWRFLGLPDGKLSENRQAIGAALDEAMNHAARAAGQTVILAPYRADGHPDHEVLGSLAADAAEAGGHGLLEFPIWYWLWASPRNSAWQSWLRVPLTAGEQQAKAAAMRAHLSQVEPLSPHQGDEVLLPAHFLEHFSRPWETFAWHGPVSGHRNAADAERIFDEVHGGNEDPWEYATSWYERRKRALTLAALPREKYDSGLEVGCSIGTLSEELAARCGEFLGVDASGAALARARKRLAARPSARTQHLTVPRDWPEGTFDLVVMSEMGYYLSPAELGALFTKVAEATSPGGTLVLCHWRHPIAGWELDGDAVHAMARRQLGWSTAAHYIERDFVLDVVSAPATADSR
jgi:LmbE family N-acetylglucosaminyl deacetylase/2-polyprenyl-3-methyl-5-hydroxy-6-metoxy-1,4-benzoquinol methylase